MTRRGDRDQRVRQFRLFCCAPFERELRVEGAHRRELRRSRSRTHAGNRLYALDERIEEYVRRLGWILLARERQAHGEHALRLETRIDALDVQHGAHQQARAQEQHDRQGDLHDDERLPQPPAARRTRPPFLERIMRIGPRRLNGGKKPDKQTGDERDRQAPPEHA